ncbi:hypothetical protein AB3S75_024728 [Citrus x aurantiifolia]
MLRWFLTNPWPLGSGSIKAVVVPLSNAKYQSQYIRSTSRHFLILYDHYCNEIRKTNSNLIVIGKTTVDNDKEDFDNDADDDDADHGDESEGEEFEQETA